MSFDKNKLIGPGLNIVLDGQWGSTGKGKLCGFLGAHSGVQLAVSSFGPNAGHTYVSADGEVKAVFSCIPNSALTAGCPALITADSVIRLEQLLSEIEVLKSLGHPGTVYVDPRCAVIQEGDEENAKKTGNHLAGTMKGTGHAISRKLLRGPGAKLAGHILEEKGYGHLLAHVAPMVRKAVKNNRKVLLEVSQGFDLSLNHGLEYPYLTSRDITVGCALNSVGVPPIGMATVIGSIRAMPIRVGNVKGGHSGPCHVDQHEITWDDVTKDSGSPDPILEKTTVTQRVRRVFTFSLEQVRRFVDVNMPDYLFLNFAQYLNYESHGVTEYDALSDEVTRFVERVECEIGVPIVLIGTGPRDDQLVLNTERYEQ